LNKLSLTLALFACLTCQLLAASNFSHFYYKKDSAEFLSWGVNQKETESSINIDGVKPFYKPKKKNKVVVAVIDTGIDPNHPFLRDNLYVNNGVKVSTKNYGVDYSLKKGKTFNPYDTHGHGTHVAGIIKSVFPHVRLMALKYYNPGASGQVNLDSTIKALKHAVDQGVDIVNYSGGGPEASEEELRILKIAEKKGILIVAAAGNEREDIDKRKNAYYPASYGLSNIITVTAHDESGNPLSASNWGKYTVDISAPGYRVKSSIPGGRAGIMSGTSQATAFVSGVAGLIKATYPHLKGKEIKRIIKAAARSWKTMAEKCVTGGILDASKALEIAEKWHNEKQARKHKLAIATSGKNSNNKNLRTINQMNETKKVYVLK
jgi:subtilisin family serine protease